MQEPSASRFPAFPYKPYAIQAGFMDALYSALEDGGVAMLESPTGTGKTISIVCSALQWLINSRAKEQAVRSAVSVTSSSVEDLPDWLRPKVDEGPTPAPRRTRRPIATVQPTLVRGLHDRLEAELKSNLHVVLQTTSAAAAAAASGHTRSQQSEELQQFVLEEVCNAGAEMHGHTHLPLRRHRDAADAVSDDDDGAGPGHPFEPPDTRPHKRQIIFCSRTHSQLSQFVGEVRRTSFASELAVVALGSRSALCINPHVKAAASPALINERCLDLQQAKSSRKNVATEAGGQTGLAGRKASKAANVHGCPHLITKGDRYEHFADLALTEPLAVEDLASLGRTHGVCPYYGSRAMLREADVVVAPYSTLLQESTRTALGLHVEGAVLIFDEAHNLVDAVNNVHSASVSHTQLAMASRQLQAYFDRFKGLLSATNARHVQLLLRVLHQLLTAVARPNCSPARHDGSSTAAMLAAQNGSGLDGAVEAHNRGLCDGAFTADSFLDSLQLDNINLFKLLRWVQESKVLLKISGYSLQLSQQEVVLHKSSRAATVAAEVKQHAAQLSNSTSALQGQQEVDRLSGLHATLSFLQALTHANADGRVLCPAHSAGGFDNTTDITAGSLKYVLLNAAGQFAKLLASAHAVILASGTLSPIAAISQQLFPAHTTHPERLRHYACGHVVPQEQLVVLVAAMGPTGRKLELRHGQRDSNDMLDEVGRLLLNMALVVPDGLVVFVPSFAYLEKLRHRWSSTGLLSSLTARKQVFVEPRAATEVEAVLAQYSNIIHGVHSNSRPIAGLQLEGRHSVCSDSRQGACGGTASGALLLCVIGAKLSEGINFGDKLGRCVAVVGMPYPNPSDPELLERMTYLDRGANAAAAARTTHNSIGTESTAATAAWPTPNSRPALPTGRDGSALTGRQYYEDLCMKAVNQTIGRVIRHAKDYAAIVLVDARYQPHRSADGKLTGVVTQLPGWIQESLDVSPTGGYGHIASRLGAFYRRRHAKLSSAAS